MSVDVSTEQNLQQELILDSEAAAALFLAARTANAWADEEISEETLQAVYALTRMAPTAMNIQPLRITWVRSPEARERLVAQLSEGNQAKTRTAPMTAILSFDTQWHDLMSSTSPYALGMVPMFDGNDELRQTMGNNNAHIQAGFFIMAARAAGLDAGPMGGFDAAGVDAAFFAGTTRKSFLVVNVGKPNGIIDRERLHRLDYDVANETV